MTRSVVLIRLCEASGQTHEAPLTEEGRAQAKALAERLAGVGIERIVSSPYARALRSIEPLAQRLGLPVEVDPRLAERVLGAGERPDWRERLRETFLDPELCLEGGELSRAAMERGAAALEEALRGGAMTTAVVTHGNLLVLLLRYFDGRFGFEAWQMLTNPDVFRVVGPPGASRVVRLWSER